jgi:hypothetical protein
MGGYPKWSCLNTYFERTAHAVPDLLFLDGRCIYERCLLALAYQWPFEQWGRFLPEHTAAASILDRPLHRAVSESVGV